VEKDVPSAAEAGKNDHARYSGGTRQKGRWFSQEKIIGVEKGVKKMDASKKKGATYGRKVLSIGDTVHQ